MSQYTHPPVKQFTHTINDGEQCSLACSIRSDDTDKLPVSDLKRHALEGDVLTVRDYGILNIYRAVIQTSCIHTDILLLGG